MLYQIFKENNFVSPFRMDSITKEVHTFVRISILFDKTGTENKTQ